MMKPYPKYKDSGVEWIGEVPEGWEKSKIKFCTDFINGYAFKSDNYVTTEGIPLIRIGNIKPEIDFNEAQKVPEEYAALFKTFVVKKNDILVALTGATIGKSSVYKSTRLALLNQRVAILRPKGKTHNNFLKIFIDSDILISRLQNHPNRQPHLKKAKAHRTAQGRALCNHQSGRNKRIESRCADEEIRD